jgi:hypothetical protein
VIEADASRSARVEKADIGWSDEQKARRPVRDYLQALDGEAARPKLKTLSSTDPAAAWSAWGATS